MNTKKTWLIIGIVALAGITIFTSVNYYPLLDQNRVLQKLVSGYERKLSELEAAKDIMESRLTLENETLNLQLKEARVQLKTASKELEAVREQVASLEKDNADLLTAQEQMQDRVSQIVKDRAELEARFNSLDELKKAIRDLKARIRREKLAQKRAKQEKKLMEGNRGYLLFGGASTSRDKVKIEVTPIPQ